ncbi:vacuolar protein sorting-associated protein 72 [Pycnococcus provasolii]
MAPAAAMEHDAADEHGGGGEEEQQQQQRDVSEGGGGGGGGGSSGPSSGSSDGGSGSSSDSEESGEDSEESLEPVKRDPLPSRHTRGRRMSSLINEEEQEADEAFWGQDFFAEEAVDEEFEASSSSEDLADSDFSDDENEVGAEQGGEMAGEAADKALLREEKGQRARALKPPSRKQAYQTAAKRREATAEFGGAGEQPKKRKAVKAPPTEALEVRKSLRTAVLERAHARAAAEAAEVPKPKKTASKQKLAEDAKPLLTQAELLAEAAMTEQTNLASLAELLAREEATKKRAAVKRAVYMGPLEQFHSKGGVNTIRFLGNATVSTVTKTDGGEQPGEEETVLVRRSVAPPSPPFGVAPPKPMRSR